MACQPRDYEGRQIIVSRSTKKGPFVHEGLIKKNKQSNTLIVRRRKK